MFPDVITNLSYIVFFFIVNYIADFGSTSKCGGHKVVSEKKIHRQWGPVQYDSLFVDTVHDP